MNKREIGIAAGKFVASIAIGTVVGNIVKGAARAPIGPVNKVLSVIGQVLLSSVLADISADYLEKEINDAIPPVILTPDK